MILKVYSFLEILSSRVHAVSCRCVPHGVSNIPGFSRSELLGLCKHDGFGFIASLCALSGFSVERNSELCQILQDDVLA